MNSPPCEPGRDCAACERLVAFRETWRLREPGWHNAPVPSFGSPDSRLLIVGLAPGLRGANATGRPFTGDYAGDLLYETLADFGFARGSYAERADDGLELVDCRVTNAVRCVPPENKPVPAEINTCRAYLSATIAAMRPRKSADWRSSRMYQRRRPAAPASGVLPGSEIAKIAFMRGFPGPTLARPQRISTWA